jgi:hypothetical protein
MSVDNAGLAGNYTPVRVNYTNLFDLSVSGGAKAAMIPAASSGLSNVLVAAGGLITCLPQTNLVLVMPGNLTLSGGGAISVDGLGHALTNGPGAGMSLSSQGSGGGYGGAGGDSASGATGGITYGSATQPVNFGSGGGNGVATATGGSQGGGRIRLSIGGAMTVDGTLSANGYDGAQEDSGGGAGGSIWIAARSVSGTGLISASGGDGDFSGGGGGGGGRIALYSPANSFTGQFSVAGGSGANPGEAGTLYFENHFGTTLSGTITGTNGLPVAGVSVLLTGGYPPPVTDAAGHYSVGVAPVWTGSLTPSLAGKMFAPGLRSLNNVIDSITNLNFLMVDTIVPTLSSALAGTNFGLNWQGLLGVNYQPWWSSNLVSWLPYGGLLTGTNGSMSLLIPLDAAPRKFFRIEAEN